MPKATERRNSFPSRLTENRITLLMIGDFSSCRLASFVLQTTLAALCLSVSVSAQTAPKRHHFLFMQYSPGNRMVELSAEGQILWEHPLPSLGVMFERLNNGNIIYAYGGAPTGVQEVDRNHKIVWNYAAKCEQVLGFSRLPNGNVLVGEQGPCRAVEVNPKGEEVRVIPLTTNEKGGAPPASQPASACRMDIFFPATRRTQRFAKWMPLAKSSGSIRASPTSLKRYALKMATPSSPVERRPALLK